MANSPLKAWAVSLFAPPYALIFSKSESTSTSMRLRKKLATEVIRARD